MSNESVPVIENNKIGPGQTERGRWRKTPDNLSEHILRWFKGDCHTHSWKSTRNFGHIEGVYDIDEITAYTENLGLKFVCLTEHSSNPASPQLQSPESIISTALLQEAADITAFNKKRGIGIFVLSGVEANVFFNGAEPTLDLPAQVLDKLDLVIASRHQIDREKNLEAIEKSLLFAIKDPSIDVIGHPDRYIRIERSWDLLRARFLGAEKYHQEMKELQNKQKAPSTQEEKARIENDLQQRYSFIKKTIGEIDLTEEDRENTELMTFRREFLALEENYWQMWKRILPQMVSAGKAFEINLNNPPSPKLVEMAVGAGADFFVNFDAHDFGQYTWEQTPLIRKGEVAKDKWAKGNLLPDDRETLKEYKQNRLSTGPGVLAVLRLARWIKNLEFFGVLPDRVINSSKEDLLKFLITKRHKRTENLEYLSA